MNCIKKLLFSLCIYSSMHSQELTTNNFNLDFEIIENGKPKNWVVFPKKNNKFVQIDRAIVKSGENAVFIEHKKGWQKNTSLIYNIPTIYSGKLLKVSAYIKTKNVKNVKFWTRIDDNGGYDVKILSDTNDWKKVELQLNLTDPIKSNFWVFGITLKGKGKVWIDNLELSIDNDSSKEFKEKSSALLENKKSLIDQISNVKVDLNIKSINSSLKPLLSSLEDKKIVAIGEDTHGTSEFYKLRAEVTKKLIQEKGFNMIILENPYDDIELLHHNLLNDDINNLMKNHLFSIYQTTEMKSFLHWLKENDVKREIEFKGCDDSYWVLDKLLKKEIAALQDKKLDSLCNLFIDKSTSSVKEYNAKLTNDAEKVKNDIDLYNKAYQDIVILENELKRKKIYSKRLRELIYNAKTSYVNYEHMYKRKPIQSRDEMMANRISFLAQDPDAKIIIWAHNAHISNSVIIDNEIGIMGKKLKERYGEKYHSIGLSSLKGNYSYIKNRFINNDHNYTDTLIKDNYAFTPEVSWEKLLSKINNNFYFESKKINIEPITENLKLVGYMKESKNDYYKLNMLEMYDTIFLIEHTNATKSISSSNGDK